MIAPCKDCKHRTADCHGTCKPYKLYEAVKRKEYQQRAIQSVSNIQGGLRRKSKPRGRYKDLWA